MSITRRQFRKNLYLSNFEDDLSVDDNEEVVNEIGLRGKGRKLQGKCINRGRLLLPAPLSAPTSTSSNALQLSENKIYNNRPF